MKTLLGLLVSVLTATSSWFAWGTAQIPMDTSFEYLLRPVPEVKMLAFGDLMLGRDVAAQMKDHGEDYPFREIFGSDAIDPFEYDLVTANLEGPVLHTPRRSDLFPMFAFDPEMTTKILNQYGFNLLNLANNHTWDHGAVGWESTLGVLHEAGMSTVGHPKNLFEQDLYETEISGIKLGFIGITDVLKPFPVNWEEAKKQISKLDQRNQFVVVMIHWGAEYKTSSSQRQQTKAHGLIDAGADLIIGHHPHVVQESEVYHGKQIYYSLGNFIFDQYFSAAVQEGLGLDIRFSLDGFIHIEEIPIDIVKGQARLTQHQE